MMLIVTISQSCDQIYYNIFFEKTAIKFKFFDKIPKLTTKMIENSREKPFRINVTRRDEKVDTREYIHHCTSLKIEMNTPNKSPIVKWHKINGELMPCNSCKIVPNVSIA